MPRIKISLNSNSHVHKSLIGLLLFGLFSCTVFAQELPPIVPYSPKLYNAGNQNWMIDQDAQKRLFFANNEGLLEFTGASWNLYPSPNETIIRSVKVIDGLIYTGCYMEFGYWKREATGILKYHSLSAPIRKYLLDDEQFWNILQYQDFVLFQSLSRIYIYQKSTRKFKIIAPKEQILKAFNTGSNLYYQTATGNLYEIENAKSKLISNDPKIKTNKIVRIEKKGEALVILTQLNGFLTLYQGKVFASNFPVNALLQASSVYSSQHLRNGGSVIGTVSDGIFILNPDYSVQFHITQALGLSNNTALSLFEDHDKNVWVGLDNGINCINLQSPVKSYSDRSGLLGTVYTSELYQGILYVGTNQGLFCKKWNSGESFRFVAGTKGQVWNLFAYAGSLFCGHDSGTFLIKDAFAIPIFSQSGTWKFAAVPNNPNLLLQGNYYGLSVLEKTNTGWRFRNKISKFDYSSKNFELAEGNQIYVSHEYKGIFRLEVDPALTKSVNVFTYDQPKKGKNAGLIKYQNQIYYASKNGIYKLNPQTKRFVRDPFFSQILDKDEYTSGKLIVDKSNKLWMFTKNYIHYFTVGKLSNKLEFNFIPISATLTNSMLGYENVTQISPSSYLIGTTDGYYTLNIDDLSFSNHPVAITYVSNYKQNEREQFVSVTDEGSFSHDQNNLMFSYAVPEFNKYINAEYQFALQGFQDNWSKWSSKSATAFKNLEPGTYTFMVRAKIANSRPVNVARYKFTILKPWYATNLALIIYLILGIYLGFFIHKKYKRYYQNQREKLIEENNLLLEIKELENEQQLMKLRNEQLAKDVDNKSKELAVSTLTLIQKNELLALIKEDLNKTSAGDATRGVKNVISKISKNISEDDNWNVFKEAFDSADKDFLKKIKQAHPALTPNDLRLCAYLRLNLSSKEIAPLLNISVRSVEIKRYRLRKKMDLPHEQGLVEYILSI